MNRIIDFIDQLGIGQCVFYEKFGIYCPGCGGTRAVKALLRGDLIESFFYHPVVLYCCVIFLIFLLSTAVYTLTKGRTKRFKIGYLTLLSVLGVVLVQWAIKVFLQVEFGYQIL